MQLQKNDIVFHNWKIKSLIGVGSFGTVYEIQREEFGRIYRAAAKVITIPADTDETLHPVKEGMTQENAVEYYRSLVEEIVSECDLMARMKGDSHIVSYEDHYVEESDNGNRWTIYIRMELLTPLLSCIADEENTLEEEEVIRLGIDICKGLETCQKFNVIHRDIKLENIFVSDTGHYKLGDFGISKTIEKSQRAVSQKGTRLYMAPEVFHGEEYNATVDIYSLGLVLFRLMNYNRAPFLPSYPQSIRIQDKEEALLRRLKGEQIPSPCNADECFSAIIRKACSFQPKDRYQTPREMRKALELLLEEKNKPFFQTDDLRAEELSETLCIQGETGIRPLYGNEKKVAEKKKKQKNAVRTAMAVIAIFVIGGAGMVIWENISISSKKGKSSSVIENRTDNADSQSAFSKMRSDPKEVLERELQKQYIKVPQVTGLEEAKAITSLVEAGCNEEDIQIVYEYSDTVGKGFVLVQSVLPETQVEKGSRITLNVSLGAKRVTAKRKTEDDDSEWIWKELD